MVFEYFQFIQMKITSICRRRCRGRNQTQIQFTNAVLSQTDGKLTKELGVQGDGAVSMDPVLSERKTPELSRPRSPTPAAARTKVKMTENMKAQTVTSHTQKSPTVEVPMHLEATSVIKNQNVIVQTPC